MKRISTFVALLVLFCATAQARQTQRYRVHYNPYAFGYHKSGLVNGGVRYSMHAFSYHHAGLIQESRTCRTPRFWLTAPRRISHGRIDACFQSASTPKRPPSYRRCVASAKARRESEEKDGLHVIRKYLAAQGHKNIYLKHQLSIENQTIGAAIVLADSDLVITYVNAEAMAALAEETGRKKQAVERLEQRLADARETMLARGGQVYAIDASDRGQILMALQDCFPLSPNAAAPTAVYAKNQ